MNALLLTALVLAADTPPQGVLPTGANGRPLNLDFETGTLKDWTADGPAFAGQPIKGDTVSARRGDMRSRHQGQFWIGGYERAGDRPTGTLTSAVFTVEHPWASFLVGGGPHPETCVELLLQPRDEVVFRASGLEQEDLRRVAVDLTKHVGKSMRIRLVDRHSGHWGHLNFDDFRFHSQKPNVPDRPGKEPPARPDEYKFAGQTPADAAKNMTVPDGFTVKLFAGEPDVHQPVAMCLDDRGRLWVAEAYAYPKRLPFPGPLLPPDQAKQGDRILIFEDANGDGTFDKRTVFQEGLNLVSGLEVGFGGVWVGAAPYLLFIPDRDRDDKPDGPPQILLDGWGYQDTHETLNTFLWGPDGWLYGCHGVFTHSKVGKPGTPDADRVKINAGVWRYHPTRHVFEVFAHGTSNPWGLDYNEHGDFFVEACVIPHLWHIVQGGRYQRQAGPHFDPHTYLDIPTIATHRHYVGANPHAGNATSDKAGGGHAHSGLLCYQGGVWPKEYHGKLFMGNIHGHRLNVDALSLNNYGGYAGHRNPDFLLSHDRHCIIVALQSGPDGNVFFTDWSDKQVCHRNDPEIWDRTNGRVFKIVHKDSKPVAGLDLSKCTDAELVEHQLNPNDWYARHARRLLHERFAAGTLLDREETRRQLADIAFRDKDDGRRLKAVWGLHVVGGLTDDMYAKLLTRPSDKSPLPGWALRLGADAAPMPAPVRAALRTTEFQGSDGPFPSTYRAAWLGAALRLPPAERWDVIESYKRSASTSNPTLDALMWYVAEPLAVADVGRLIRTWGPPGMVRLAVRRAVEADVNKALTALLTMTGNPNGRYYPLHALYVIPALNEALKGRGRIVPPAGWAEVRADLTKIKYGGPAEQAAFRDELTRLALRFGDESALAELRELVLDAGNPADRRRTALESLQDANDPNLPAVLRKLLADDDLRGAAIRGLAAHDDPATVAALLAAYPKLPVADKRAVVGTLATRASFAAPLLDAIGENKIPAADVPAETIRQLRNLGVKAIDDRIAAVWGIVRETPAERKKLIADWTKKLNAPPKSPPDLSAGRAVYARICQQCHTLYGTGGKVGPDITGSNRADLAYLLENMFDPSAVIPKEYAATKLDLVDGRVLTGIIKEETKTTLTVVTATETLTVPVADVEKRTPSELSMMPDDLTRQLKEPEIRELIAYLRHPSQVPIAATAENAKEFFNGRDLTGWDGDNTLWRVENGEIVGKTAGLKRNAFLVSQMAVSDFRLTLKMKLSPNAENSGIQFRSVPLPDGEMRGPQADAGASWWGKLYEESGRGLLWKQSGEQHVKPDDWNEYVIEAVGSRVRTWLNGQPCVDLDDPRISRQGVIGLQMHSGKALEVRFKDVRLEVK